MEGDSNLAPVRPATLPLVILAGSDRTPATLPESGADKHPLLGSKGFDVRIGGRHLIDLLIERLEACGAFGPIYIAGPASTYGSSWKGVEVIDTDGSLGENIERSVTHLVDVYGEAPLAMATCDILPEVDELKRVMADYFTHVPLNYWFPFVLVPDRAEDLGASQWKPRYQMSAAPGEPRHYILPGHVIVVDIAAMRKKLVFQAFHLAYKTRNRSVSFRLTVMVAGVLSNLVSRDLLRLATFKPPTITWRVLTHAIRLALGLMRGTTSSTELAEHFHGMFTRDMHTRRFPDRRGRLPLVEALSLAKDIDTEEEALERAREFEHGES